MEEQLKRIKEKLEYLQQQGWEKYRNIFAVWSHRLITNPPIPFEELLNFEKKYNLRLPEEYRRFLLEINNGGAGPYYGLLPLEKWHSIYYSSPNNYQHFSNPCLVRPDPKTGFGLKPKYNYLNRWYYGTLPLCNMGCHFRASLVVVGEEYGKILYNGPMGEPYYMPDPDFLSWYERWLDEVLTEKADSWFGGTGWMGNNENPSNWQPLDLRNFWKNR